MEREKILIIEDDKNIMNILKIQLSREGYEVVTATDGLKGVEASKEEKPDIILLDWMLPQIGGIDVCKIIKSRSTVPIIFLTSRGREEDVIKGLEAGGDDYITKPFKFQIVLARIRSNLRKYKSTGILTHRDLTMDVNAKMVYLHGEVLILGRYEFKLLKILMENSTSIVSRARIINKIWEGEEDEYSKGNNLDVIMNSLRKKVSPKNKNEFIKTYRGMGYGMV